MNLFITTSNKKAFDIARLLGLDREEWFEAGVGTALTGRQFDRIVVVLPSGRDLRKNEKEWLEFLKTHMKPNEEKELYYFYI